MYESPKPPKHPPSASLEVLDLMSKLKVVLTEIGHKHMRFN